ncbi:MAG: hypothetical protein WCK89_08560 [bacterium]
MPKTDPAQQHSHPTTPTHPTRNRDNLAGDNYTYPFNVHRLNDHPGKKRPANLGRRHPRRSDSGHVGGGSLAPVPPPQIAAGETAPVSGFARKRTDRRRARPQDSGLGGAAALTLPTPVGAKAPIPAPQRTPAVQQPENTTRPAAHARRIAGGHCAACVGTPRG